MSARPTQCPGTTPLTPFVDVSKWQGQVDWKKVAADPARYAMAIARGPVGNSIDSTFARNWTAIKRAGLIRGVYIAFHPSRTAQQHVDSLRRALGDDFRPGVDAPPCLDIEKLEDVVAPIGTGPEDVDALVDRALGLVNLIELKLGVQPWIYAGSFWHFQVAQVRPKLANALAACPLWTPHYEVRCPGVPAGWQRWSMWQHSSSGRVQGIAGRVDLSWFRGSPAELVKAIADSQARVLKRL